MTQLRIVSLFIALSTVLLEKSLAHEVNVKIPSVHSNRFFRHGEQQKERQTQDEEDDPCGAGELISGFSVYNAKTNTSTPLSTVRYMSEFFQSYISLEDYPGKKINIIVNTCPNQPQPIGCVKISLGDFKTTYEKSVPYTLYGDSPITGFINVAKPRKTSWQPLQAWTYSSSECIGNATSYKRVDVHIVPRTTGTIAINPIVTLYQNTITTATEVDTKAIVNATCEYIYDALDYGFLYKSNVGLTKLTCFNVPLTTVNYTAPVPPLAIVYKIFATFHVGLDINPYINRDIPKRTEVLTRVKELFYDLTSIGPFAEEIMSSFVKTRIGAASPYYPYTQITFPFET